MTYVSLLKTVNFLIKKNTVKVNLKYCIYLNPHLCDSCHVCVSQKKNSKNFYFLFLPLLPLNMLQYKSVPVNKPIGLLQVLARVRSRHALVLSSENFFIYFNTVTDIIFLAVYSLSTINHVFSSPTITQALFIYQTPIINDCVEDSHRKLPELVGAH